MIRRCPSSLEVSYQLHIYMSVLNLALHLSVPANPKYFAMEQLPLSLATAPVPEYIVFLVMAHKAGLIIFLFSIGSYDAAGDDQDIFLDHVQDSLDEVFAEHVAKWEKDDRDLNIIHREKRTGAFPKIKRKRKKTRACQNMAGILGEIFYFIEKHSLYNILIFYRRIKCLQLYQLCCCRCYSHCQC